MVLSLSCITVLHVKYFAGEICEYTDFNRVIKETIGSKYYQTSVFS